MNEHFGNDPLGGCCSRTTQNQAAIPAATIGKTCRLPIGSASREANSKGPSWVHGALHVSFPQELTMLSATSVTAIGRDGTTIAHGCKA